MDTACLKHDAPYPLDLPAAIAAYTAADEFFWLDPQPDGPGKRWPRGLIAARPLAVIAEYEGREASLHLGDRLVDSDANAWRLIERALRRLPCNREFDGLGPGWFGFIGYELARQIERLPPRVQYDLPIPLTRLCLFDRAILVDEARHTAHFIHAPHVRAALEVSDADPQWMERWGAATRETRDLDEISISDSEAQFEQTRAEYEQRVQRVLDYIAAGDAYQVNLSQRIQLPFDADALAFYAALRRRHRASFGAVLRWTDGGLASLSPELMLQVDNGVARTGPIKGTRPRTGNAAQDSMRRAALLASEKERAELAMIVDLHRNDLGKVCVPGSVVVEDARRLESHAAVFHTVADIRGRLREDRDSVDALREMFPAGSVTGAPKLRAMQIIDELEPARRGAYTGAIGGISLNGAACFSVAIRTAQIGGGAASIAVGGGIVAESEPAAEYDETLAKARGLFDALAPHDSASRQDAQNVAVQPQGLVDDGHERQSHSRAHPRRVGCESRR